jgi:hypothetical protein
MASRPQAWLEALTAAATWRSVYILQLERFPSQACQLPSSERAVLLSMRAAYAGNGSAADEHGSLLDIEKWPAWLLQAALQYFAVSPLLCASTPEQAVEED